MATLVFVHAHPDDEASLTSGTMARAVAEGHRVVLVVCTNGDLGEVPDDLAAGETLVDRRKREAATSAAAIGVHRTIWLGYGDSGMYGWPQNDDPTTFGQADVDEAAERVAAILREEHADVVVVYDFHGAYGHPDHVQVHRVGHRAADLAGTPRRFETTWNRDTTARFIAADPDMRADFDPAVPMEDGYLFGTAADEIDLAVDVTPYLAAKRAAIVAHASQVTDTGMFLTMPDEAFAEYFRYEWFLEPGTTAPPRTGWLLDPVDGAA
ncbi:MAG: PIG-L family deacetylase [Ilumatobacteraceae bacterium]